MKKIISIMLVILMLMPTVVSADEEATQFMDCFDPMPIIEKLKDDVWGAELVGARDQGNGLEDRIIQSGSMSYWDGGIIKDDDTGKYYLYGSQWDQSKGHGGWTGSYGIGAVSDNLYGPYEKMDGYLWPDNKDGKGHNVFPFELKKDDPYGKYAIINSDNGRPGDIFVSDSLDGDWKYLTSITSNMVGSGFNCVNVAVFLRPDGKYEALARHGDIAIADDLKGPWTVMVDCLWDQVPGLPYTDADGGHRLEDPTMWYSNGMYHIVVNHWKQRKAYYLTSEDGITNWRVHPGSAYEPDADFLRYTDGTVNHWNKIERPYAYVEDGELKAFTFAVIDSAKDKDKGNDQHGSKIIVVPFNSEKLDTLIDNPHELFLRDGISPIADSNIQSWRTEMPYNYGGNTYMRVQVNNNDSSYGVLGEKIAGGDGTDCKIGYLKYDVSDFELDKVNKATLSFVYRKRLVGSGETDKIKVALAESNWSEGSGSDILGKTATEDDITWAKKPTLIYDDNTVCYSDEFNTNEAFQILEVDVTKLVQSIDENSENISFAFTGTTQGNTLSFLTKELGEGYSVLLNIESEENIAVEGIKTATDGMLVTKGERKKLDVTVFPQNATDTSVIWTTTDKNICYVDGSGYLHAVGEGKATVTATSCDGGYSVDIAVTVCAWGEITKVIPEKAVITVNGVEMDEITMKDGESAYLNVVVKPDYITGDTNYTWITSSIANGVVTKDGKLTCYGNGNFTVTAKSARGYEAKLNVTVASDTRKFEKCEVESLIATDTGYSSSWIPEKVLDGITSSAYSSKDNANVKYMQFELKEKTAVTKVAVTGRFSSDEPDGKFANRINGAKIYASNEPIGTNISKGVMVGEVKGVTATRDYVPAIIDVNTNGIAYKYYTLYFDSVNNGSNVSVAVDDIAFYKGGEALCETVEADCERISNKEIKVSATSKDEGKYIAIIACYENDNILKNAKIKIVNLSENEISFIEDVESSTEKVVLFFWNDTMECFSKKIICE